MKWFDIFMDSCRYGLELSEKNLKLYLPNIIGIVINAVLVFILVIFAVFSGVGTIFRGNLDSMSFQEVLKSFMPLIVSFFIIVGIMIPVIICMVEAGILMMSKKISINGSANFTDFMEGLKRYWVQILIGVSIVGLVAIIIFIPALILLLLADVFTCGYGFAAGIAVFNVLFGTWGAVMVVDEISAWQAIKKGYGFGRKNFWALFLMFLSSILIAGLVSILIKCIPLLGILAAPFGAAIINTYFRLVLVKYYYEVTKDSRDLTGSINNY